MKEKTTKSRGIFWFIEGILILLIAVGILFLMDWVPLRGFSDTQLVHMEEKVRSLQELVTVNQVYRDVIYKEERRLFADKRVLFSIHFHLRAGVKLNEAEVSLNERGIPVITLPPAEILSVDADETTIEQVFIKESFSEIRYSDYMSLIIEEKERLILDAEERGILIQAQTQAERILIQMFRMAGYDQVILQIREEL